MINLLYTKANGKIAGPSGIWTHTFGIPVWRSTNWAIESNWERRANSTNLSELRFVVNNLTLDISIGEDSTIFPDVGLTEKVYHI